MSYESSGVVSTSRVVIVLFASVFDSLVGDILCRYSAKVVASSRELFAQKPPVFLTDGSSKIGVSSLW